MSRKGHALLAAGALLFVGCDVLGAGAPSVLGASPSGGPSGSPAPAASAGPSASPGASAAPAASAAPSADPRLPAEAPYIEGEVISAEPAGAGQLHSGRIHVVAATGGNQAVVTLVGATAVWRRGPGGALTRGAAADVKAGQQVRVWAGGPIRESFPVQFDAKAVLILADG